MIFWSFKLFDMPSPEAYNHVVTSICSFSFHADAKISLIKQCHNSQVHVTLFVTKKTRALEKV
jgi:hypothetical protein